MNKIAPTNESPTLRDIKTIIVKPVVTNERSRNDSSFGSIGLEEIKRPDAKVFGIPIKKRETHINRSDSFQSKFIRYARADTYTTYDTKWSRIMIGCSVFSGILAIAMFVMVIYYYFSVDSYSSMYVLDTVMDKDTLEKNKSLNGLNIAGKIISWSGMVIGAVSLIASVCHWKTIFDKNSFRPSQTQPR